MTAFLAQSMPNGDSARLILLLGLQESQYRFPMLEGCDLSLRVVHWACWPTSSRHARLSAACLVEATSDNNLKDESNSMSIPRSKL
jgi:hypothetical protein